MQIKKITYQEDEVIFELIDGNKRYKLQINRLKDLHDEQTVEKWCKYINKNFFFGFFLHLQIRHIVFVD